MKSCLNRALNEMREKAKQKSWGRIFHAETSKCRNAEAGQWVSLSY